jgi:tripeptide aminopeptidase
VRDFEDDLLDEKVERVRRIAAEIAGDRATVEAEAQYPNMRAHIEPFPEVLDKAKAAYAREGIEVVEEPIRGGTDGSRLSAMGLPTPNVFAGGHEFHSPREWVTVQDMAAAAAVIVNLAAEWAEGA